ncbi:MAG TPA: hypothetical protein VJ952_05055, partial [Opitutales bacterium]|nr:hypothetical protein [Opitutales bacterium]
MLPKHYFRCCFLLTVGFFIVPCAAQENESISLQFVTFPMIMEPEPVELMVGEEKTIPIVIPSNRLSPVYKAKKLNQWVVGKTVEAEDGSPEFKGYGQTPALASD